MIVAIIPARAGSKRIKNKNINLFFNKPLISYAINYAKKSKIFDKIIVSTDSKKIEKISKKYGAEVIKLRPKKLANDKIQIPEVMKYELNLVENITKKKIKYICCILPTSIFNKSFLLKKGLKILKGNKLLNYVFCATKTPASVYRCFVLNKGKKVSMLFPKNFNIGSENLRTTYYDFGNFYWGTRQAWLKKKIIFSNNSRVIEIDNKYYSDINTLDDWKSAEKVYKKYLNEKK